MAQVQRWLWTAKTKTKHSRFARPPHDLCKAPTSVPESALTGGERLA